MKELELEKDGSELATQSYEGRALEKYPQDCEQRKQLKMVVAGMLDNSSVKRIEEQFEFCTENQIYWREYTLKSISRLDLFKLDTVISKFKNSYGLPDDINQMTSIRITPPHTKIKTKYTYTHTHGNTKDA